MKYEPLKGKILLWNQVTGDILTIDGKYFLETKTENGKFIEIILKSDIKSALRGLLQEIENRIKELDRYEQIFTKRFYINCTNRRDEIETRIIPLIKKWFPDVIE